MEAVDAGDVPLSAVIDSLLSPEGLRELIGTYRAACFVLARRVLVRDFFDELIRNVDTIDQTLRDNIAFIVFHGRQSSLLTPPADPDRYRYDRSIPVSPARRHHPYAPMRYQVEGLSVSDGGCIHAERLPAWNPRFDDEMMERIRQRDIDVPMESIAMVTERATNILMERFGVAEAKLPALLFVDGARPSKHVLVPLDPVDPMASLYRNVLTPLADEFGRVTPHWQLARERTQIRSRLDQLEPARRPVESARLALSDAENAIVEAAAPGDTPADIVAAAHARVEALEQFQAAFESAQTLGERLDLISADDPNYSLIAAKRIGFAALDRSHAELSASEDKESRRAEIVALNREAHRLRDELGRLCKQSREALAGELARRRVDPLQRVPAALFAERDTAAERLRQREVWLASKEAETPRLNRQIDALDARKAREDAELREAGYDDAFLAGQRPNSITVVEALIARGEVKPDGAAEISEKPEHHKSVLEGPYTKAGVVLAGLALIFGAIQVWPILFPKSEVAAAPEPPKADRAASTPAQLPAKATVSIIDSERPTRAEIYRALLSDEESDVAPLGKIDGDWIPFADSLGCRRPDVVVVHLHAFRVAKGGEVAAEDKLFPGLLAVRLRSPETRFVLYSSTFGQSDPQATGKARRVVTMDRKVLLARMSGIARRLTHDAQTGADYAAMLEKTSFVAWPLPGALGETNRQQLVSAVATAGRERAAQRAPASPRCK